LVSARCVVFAIGTDIGGSIRSPAACNGIIGFKPTAHRSTNRGVIVPAVGYSMDQSPIISAAGPLCNSVDDVKRYLNALWSENFFNKNL